MKGKQHSASNSRSHGLTTSVGAQFDSALLFQLSEYIEREGLDLDTAIQIAGKILDYERNLAYQRELYTDQLKSQDASADKQKGSSLDEELNIFNEFVDHRRFTGQPIGKRELNFIVKSKLKMVQLWSRMEDRKQRNKEKREEASVRYLKRASNQLIKSLKVLKSV